ncbi:MAG TPA: AI-2E family transporter [Candidatus Nitrosocosmicus sp.]|nr:AI-2E family transporter [Candidatus Nitrosocosmicus sp.]
MNPLTQKVEISARTIIFTVVFLIFLRILWLNRELIYALFLAFIFMSALRPPVNFLSKKRIPRPLSILIVFAIFFSAISLILSIVIPPLVAETFAFFKNIPQLAEKNFPALSGYFDSSAFKDNIPNIGGNIVEVIKAIFSNFIFLISVFFFTFFFLLDENLIKNLLAKFFPEDQADSIMATIQKIQERMGSWVWAEIILMVTIGSLTYIGLTLLGVKYALPLAIIAGLLEVLPMIGPIISAIPAFFVAVSTSWFSGFSVIALYFIIQQLENNVVVPGVMKRTVGINPLLTLIALTIGGKLGGLMGAFLSVPVALLIEIVVGQMLKDKK